MHSKSEAWQNWARANLDSSSWPTTERRCAQLTPPTKRENCAPEPKLQLHKVPDLSRIVHITRISNTPYGSVIQGEARAVKIMEKLGRPDKDIMLMRREIEVMRRIDHPNCIKFYDVYESRDKIFIVMELLSGGNMLDRIVAAEHFSEAEAARCFVQVMSAVDYLHQSGVVHRDLKPENIMYRPALSCKLHALRTRRARGSSPVECELRLMLRDAAPRQVRG